MIRVLVMFGIYAAGFIWTARKSIRFLDIDVRDDAFEEWLLVGLFSLVWFVFLPLMLAAQLVRWLAIGAQQEG